MVFLSCGPLTAQAAVSSSLNINYHPQAFTAPVSLQSQTLTESENLPWEWEPLTSAYEYKFVTDGIYDPSRPLEVKINYSEKNNYLKQIFTYDSLAQVWQPLTTVDLPFEQAVKATINSTSGRLIVLANPDILTVGTASWYKFKNGLFAASPDFAKGTVLRVYNLDNNKFVDVTINDYGPERAKHPDRVVDLDKVAFEKIANPGSGLAKVKIEPLKVVVPIEKKLLAQNTSWPNLTASSAVIMLEKGNQVLWDKQATAITPLASLTKLVAAKVFLDTKPDLKKVVSYKVQDEKYNYQYCRPGESARLTVKDGDTLTIENLLYSALVGSANNAVESLVRVSGLNRQDFIAKMNEMVRNWGASTTSFIEPTGLSAKNVSSPLDYAIITKEVLADALIKKISITERYTFKTINTKKSHTINNTNQLIKTKKYPVSGTKTGYLDEAGYCLMTRVETPRGNLVVVNFGSKSKAANFFDNEQLLRYGLRLVKDLK